MEGAGAEAGAELAVFSAVDLRTVFVGDADEVEDAFLSVGDFLSTFLVPAEAAADFATGFLR